MVGAGPVSAYNAGVRAAEEELAERSKASGDDKRLLAAQMLSTMTLRADDEFECGYRDLLAFTLNRWCKHCRRLFQHPNRWNACPDCLPVEYADGEGYTIHDRATTEAMSDRWELHTLIDSNGGADLWLYDTDLKDEKCPGRTPPAHENLGKLPAEFVVKVRRTRCGRMTRSGKPCRNGPWCKVHRQ